MRTGFFISVLVSLFLAEAGSAHTGSIAIKMKLSPAGTINAKSEALEAEFAAKGPEDSFTVKNATLALDTLKTGIALRDSHMRDKYLETGKYPMAKLTIAVGKKGRFAGDLILREKTKRISGTYTLSGNTLEAKFNCRFSDFAIASAKYVGVGVADEVEVSASLPLTAPARQTAGAKPSTK